MRATTLAAATLMALYVGAAEGGVITTSLDRSTFEAGFSGGDLTVETFGSDGTFHLIPSGVLNSATNEGGITPGMIQPGVTYSAPVAPQNLFLIDVGAGFEGGYLDGFDDALGDFDLTVTFDGPVTGFGFDTNVFMGSDFDLTVNFADGAAYTDRLPILAIENVNLRFFGFRSSATDITSLTIRGVGFTAPAFAIDNFTFGTAAPAVPEPGTLALLSLGGVGMAAGAWRKHRSAAVG